MKKKTLPLERRVDKVLFDVIINRDFSWNIKYYVVFVIVRVILVLVYKFLE